MLWLTLLTLLACRPQPDSEQCAVCDTTLDTGDLLAQCPEACTQGCWDACD